jgi:hypothetical protein
LEEAKIQEFLGKKEAWYENCWLIVFVFQYIKLLLCFTDNKISKPLQISSVGTFWPIKIQL